ncbi:Protein phosphatase 1 regulatory inhibitor subunit 16B [Labeo rohita]|uniref:Protein phosphatase 1 regulatory inhibitor subunit 16B n=1 Tax=Labeo rohita TaxID=84645 RepID=A0ABQ8MMC2_LABRO|nr:Protein phosphatase 1 regulatory inhibitor subunit 16B [Labeo rohita]
MSVFVSTAAAFTVVHPSVCPSVCLWVFSGDERLSLCCSAPFFTAFLSQNASHSFPRLDGISDYNKRLKTNKQTSSGLTAALHLISCKRLSSLEDLEEHRSMCFNMNFSLSVCLCQCCIDNYEDMVRILLAHGATVNAQDNELWTPLHAAATCGHTGLDDPTLDIIETAMANRGITQEMINETRAAVERKMLGDIQNLLQDGADINQHDSQGATLTRPAPVCSSLVIGLMGAGSAHTNVHVAELLVSHGANLNAKTYMEETPIDLCEDEEFRNHLLEKVVRRASLSDRHNLCRKEYQTEAIVWRGGREEEERERESDQENSHSTQPNDAPRSPGILKDGRRQNGTISSAPAPTASNGDPVTPDHRDPDPSPSVEEPKSKDRPQTLSELKKQRAAAKLLTQPVLNGHLGNGSTKASPEDPRMPLVSSNGSAVYFTPASGDPPLLRFKQPIEDDDPKTHSCCCRDEVTDAAQTSSGRVRSIDRTLRMHPMKALFISLDLLDCDALLSSAKVFQNDGRQKRPMRFQCHSRSPAHSSTLAAFTRQRREGIFTGVGTELISVSRVLHFTPGQFARTINMSRQGLFYIRMGREKDTNGGRRVFTDDHRSAEAGSSHAHARIIFSVIPVYVGAMFHCRRSVSAASLFLQRLNFTGPLQEVNASRSLRNSRAACCSRVYRRLTASKPVLSRSCLHETPFGSSSDLVTHARMAAAFALNAAAPRREYSDARNRDRNVLKLSELESFPSVRSSAPVTIQTRQSSTTPEKTRDESAANIQTQDQVSSVSGAEGQRSDEKPSKTQQLRKVFKEYGAVGVSFHIGISLISLGMFYLAVSRMAAGTSTFVLAYAVHKLFAPVRISITLVSVPLIVRHLRKTGLFRAGPSGPRPSCEAHYGAAGRPHVCPLHGPHGYVQIGDSDRPSQRCSPGRCQKALSNPTDASEASWEPLSEEPKCANMEAVLESFVQQNLLQTRINPNSSGPSTDGPGDVRSDTHLNI